MAPMRHAGSERLRAQPMQVGLGVVYRKEESSRQSRSVVAQRQSGAAKWPLCCLVTW